jgi:hypothetical protein
MDGGYEIACEFIVPGCDAAKIREPTEHALDDIAAFVGGFVVAVRMLAGRIGRDYRLDPPLGQLLAQAVGITSSVGQEAAGMGDHADEAASTDQIVGITGRDHEGQRPADMIRQRVDFCRLPAARTSDGIVEGPPFAPAAERCALT